jgi:hypothetical protein
MSDSGSIEFIVLRVPCVIICESKKILCLGDTGQSV